MEQFQEVLRTAQEQGVINDPQARELEEAFVLERSGSPQHPWQRTALRALQRVAEREIITDDQGGAVWRMVMRRARQST